MVDLPLALAIHATSWYAGDPCSHSPHRAAVSDSTCSCGAAHADVGMFNRHGAFLAAIACFKLELQAGTFWRRRLRACAPAAAAAWPAAAAAAAAAQCRCRCRRFSQLLPLIFLLPPQHCCEVYCSTEARRAKHVIKIKALSCSTARTGAQQQQLIRICSPRRRQPIFWPHPAAQSL